MYTIIGIREHTDGNLASINSDMGIEFVRVCNPQRHMQLHLELSKIKCSN